VCRIAGILHLAEHARSPEAIPPTIRGETFERAVRIGRYFLEHARAAFDAMESDETSELAKRVWAWLARKGLRTFTERDAQRAVHRAAGDTRAALAILVDRRLVRALPAPKSAGGQPPSQSYDVNPRARQ
jgi:replicative DNA helicase